MATLTGKQLKDSYQGLLTIKTADDANPLSGRLENGLGNAITALGIGTDSPFFTTSGRASFSLNGTSSSLLAFGKNGSSENYILADAGGFTIANTSSSLPTTFYNNGLNRAQIKSSGDISFSDTSANEAFYWDASTARLGLGTQTPDALLHIESNGSSVIRLTDNDVTVEDGSIAGKIEFENNDSSGGLNAYIAGINEGVAGDIGLSFATGAGGSATPRMRIDSSGNVGIGTDSANSIVDIRENAVGGQARLRLFNLDQTNSTAQSALLFLSPDIRANGVEIEAVKENADFSTSSNRDIAMVFKPVLDNTATERMRIDSSGRVGIGVTPSATLHIDNPANPTSLRIGSNTTDDCFILFNTDGNDWAIGADRSASNSFKISDNSSLGTADRLVIDTSGNVLVGKTSLSNGVAGIELNNTGQLVGVFASGTHILGRNTNDGSILTFEKDGTTVGQVGTIAGLLSIGSNNNVALTFTSSAIRPSNNDGSGRDNAIDLGQSGNRFQDLYLGGNVYLGGTTSANALDDYEEGTWTPTYTTSGTDFTSVTYDTGFTGGKYTKVGDLVHIQGTLRTDGITVGSASGTIEIAGLPFAIGSSTNGRDGFITINIGVATAFAGDHPVTMYGGAGNSRIVPMTRNTANGATNNLQVSDLDTGTDKNLIYFSGTYKS